MAFLKGSFYENARRFASDDNSVTPFRGVRARKLEAPEPILEHTVVLKERNDGLAHHYYSDSRGWRRIADANPDAIFFEDLLWEAEPIEDNGRERLGGVVLIPRRKETR